MQNEGRTKDKEWPEKGPGGEPRRKNAEFMIGAFLESERLLGEQSYSVTRSQRWAFISKRGKEPVVTSTTGTRRFGAVCMQINHLRQAGRFKDVQRPGPGWALAGGEAGLGRGVWKHSSDAIRMPLSLTLSPLLCRGEREFAPVAMVVRASRARRKERQAAMAWRRNL